MKNTKVIKNIGEVKLDEISFCYTNIGLYIPLTEISDNIQKELESCHKSFTEGFKKEFPQLKIEDYIVSWDVSLFLDLDSDYKLTDVGKKKIVYTIGITLWVKDETGKELKAEFYDPFEIDINNEDSKHLKKMVIQKLSEYFF